MASVEETDLDLATYLWLAASTGARRSQMLGLRWADIDFPHSAIGFSRAYVDGPAGPVLRATKTDRTYRVAVDEASMQRLVDHCTRTALIRVIHRNESPDSITCAIVPGELGRLTNAVRQRRGG